MTLQYFKPEGPYFVGDCMPFYHDGTFRLFYLLDENHHAARDGLGGINGLRQAPRISCIGSIIRLPSPLPRTARARSAPARCSFTKAHTTGFTPPACVITHSI